MLRLVCFVYKHSYVFLGRSWFSIDGDYRQQHRLRAVRLNLGTNQPHDFFGVFPQAPAALAQSLDVLAADPPEIDDDRGGDLGHEASPFEGRTVRVA